MRPSISSHERLESGGRAGLVATNSISQNRNRGPSLDYIVDHEGVITSAVSKQPWPGDAVVNVSIVNWIRGEPSAPAVLDGLEVASVTPALRPGGSNLESALRLVENRGRCFQGPVVVGVGFILEPDEAEQLLASPLSADVIRPLLTTEDLVSRPDQGPSRYVIDFGDRSLEEVAEYPDVLEIVRLRVKPERDRNRELRRRKYWWRHGRPGTNLRAALVDMPRYVAGSRVGKRIHFAWADARTCPSDATNAFAFADDQSLGVLLSTSHGEWARHQSSTLRIDIRYTPTSAFETFPWPTGDLAAAGNIAHRLYVRRSEICLERQIGLTTLYNEVDDGAYRDLKELHNALDEAVAAAYGWPISAAHDPKESNRLLLELNRAIAAGEIDYHPFD